MLERSEHSDTRHRRIAREEQANVATLQPQIRVGDWLWLCRLGAESDVCEELALYRVNGELAQPALVRSNKKPRGEVPLAFARQGIPVSALLLPDAQAIVKAVRG